MKTSSNGIKNIKRGRPAGSKNKPKTDAPVKPISFDEVKREFMFAEEVASILRFHPQKIRQMAFKGEMPAHRIGGTWRFWKTELIEWLKSEEKGGAICSAS